jgi:hypothetical protein
MAMSEWRESKLQTRGVLADPFYDWALTRRISILDTVEWLPVLIELRPEGDFKGSAEEFSRQAARLRLTDSNSWAAHVRVPPFYEALPKRIKGPLKFVSLLARKPFLAAIYANQAPAAGIRRFEIGRATLATDTTTPQTPMPVAAYTGALTPEVLVGVIDDGIGFAHERFLSTDGTTRIEFFWDQMVPSTSWFAWGYGRELTKRDPAVGIDKLMSNSRHGSLVDEDEVYRLSGQVDFTQPNHKPLAPRAAHGTHVMDLACRSLSAPPPGVRPIVAVQLPTDTVADTSGATLGPQVFNGLCYILAKAWAIESALQMQQLLPVVANVSYGTIAGPHDGSSLLEEAMDFLVAICQDTFRIVLPAGNNHLSRCHAHFSLASGQSKELRWRVLPDDWTQSYLEIWIPDGTADTGIAIVAPDGSATQSFHWGTSQTLVGATGVVGLASYYPPGVVGQGALLRMSLEGTGDPDGLLPTAPAGLWRITITAGTEQVRDIRAWIQRDDAAPGYATRGRQSYFDDPNYACCDDGGRAIDNDTHPLTANSCVKRAGTLNAIATGSETIVIGGFRSSDGAPALYSAAGPLVHPPGRGAPSPDGPDAMWPSDDSSSFAGIVGAGTRSSSCFAMHGTSVAAPQATRWISNEMAAGRASDRAAVFAAAAAKQIGLPSPPAERGGGGRFQMPPNRLPPRIEP